MNRLSRLCLGAVLILAGGASIAIFGTVNSLQCDRLQPTRVDCQLRSSGILGEKTTAIAQLRDAKIEKNRSSSRKNRNGSRNEPTYRIILIAENGRFPLTEYYSNWRSQHQNNTDKIRAYLNNPTETTLKIQKDPRWLMYPFGGIFIIAGIALILGAPVQEN